MDVGVTDVSAKATHTVNDHLSNLDALLFTIIDQIKALHDHPCYQGALLITITYELKMLYYF